MSPESSAPAPAEPVRVVQTLLRRAASARPPPAPHDAGRVSGAGAARLLRERARVHGGLWASSAYPDRPVASIRFPEGIWREQFAILDNCHVRDEPSPPMTSARPSAFQMTASAPQRSSARMKNYAGHRLAPWLGHVMVSRSGDGPASCSHPARSCSYRPTTRLVLVSGRPSDPCPKKAQILSGSTPTVIDRVVDVGARAGGGQGDAR